jgi:hypothetical protein
MIGPSGGFAAGSAVSFTSTDFGTTAFAGAGFGASLGGGLEEPPEEPGGVLGGVGVMSALYQRSKRHSKKLPATFLAAARNSCARF